MGSSKGKAISHMGNIKIVLYSTFFTALVRGVSRDQEFGRIREI